jgi:hypothetical protein
MKTEDFKLYLSRLSDNELYSIAKKYFTMDYLGFSHAKKKLNLIHSECRGRNPGIFIEAAGDAYVLSDSINLKLNKPGDIDVIDIKRIDFMNEDELKSLIFARNENHIGLDSNSDKTGKEYDIWKIEPNLSVLTLMTDRFGEIELTRGTNLLLSNDQSASDGDLLVYDCNGLLALGFCSQSGNKTSLESINKKNLYFIGENDILLGVIKKIIRVVKYS